MQVCSGQCAKSCVYSSPVGSSLTSTGFGDVDVFKAIAIIWALFLVLFVLIVIEESFLGGRRRRRLEKAAKERRDAGNTGH
jgi:hypothetical protein